MIRVTLEVEDMKACITDEKGITLPEAIEAFEGALRGAGFIVDGHLDVINEED